MTNKIIATTNRKTTWLLWALLILAAFLLVFVPVWLIQPFKAQTLRVLDISFVFKNWSPLLTLLAGVATLLLAVWLWRGARWWQRAGLVLGCGVMLLCAWLARQNHFEWMFSPLAQTAYAKPQEAAFLEAQDMVLAVQENGEAVVYPVRLMAYHHIAQDVVGGVPIAATY